MVLALTLVALLTSLIESQGQGSMAVVRASRDGNAVGLPSILHRRHTVFQY